MDAAVLVEDPDCLVDLSFLPSGTNLILDSSTLESLPSSVRTLFLVAQDISSIYDTATSWLNVKKKRMCCVVWNSQYFPYAAHTIIKLAHEMPFTYVKILGQNLHITYSNHSVTAHNFIGVECGPQYIQEMVDSQHNHVTIPSSLYKQILWRYNYLLENYNTLAEDLAAYAVEQKMLSPDNVPAALPTFAAIKKSLKKSSEAAASSSRELSSAISKTETLNKQLSQELSVLQHKYDALSNSQLGKLTLRYWNWRNRKRKED